MNPVGRVFGKLTVLSRAENDRFQRTQWHCRCECGRTCVVALFRMTKGHTKSCGCIRGRRATPKRRGTPTYNSWSAMKQRCRYPRHQQWEHYGGRGIRVCDRWLSFENFLADMGERPAGTTIDRIDRDGHYEPGNCRWASESTQSRNRCSTLLVEIDGTTRCVKDWCALLDLNADQVYGRIRRGMEPREALR